MVPIRCLTLVVASLLVLAGAVQPAVAEEYSLGVDDVLAISVWDNKDLDEVVFVRPDGKISLPLAGEVEARGMSVAQLETKLMELYRRTIKVPRVTVVVREIHSRPIFFVGGVARPGALQLTQDLTMLQAISQVGGAVDSADLESAFVLRSNAVIPVDLAQLIQKRDISQNIKLQPGDTIVVPIADVVYVQGEVKSPSAIKYTRDLTVLKAVAEAGNLTSLAAGSRVSLVRGEGLRREYIKVNVDDMLKGSAPDVPLKPKDIVVVPQRLF